MVHPKLLEFIKEFDGAEALAELLALGNGDPDNFEFSIKTPGFAEWMKKWRRDAARQKEAGAALAEFVNHDQWFVETHGPKLWKALHERATSISIIDAKAELEFFERFVLAIPCGECRLHWLEMMERTPPPLDDPWRYFVWTVDRHNEVNQKLSKPIMSIDAARRLWAARPIIIENHQGTGDAVLLTGALRDLHLSYPGRFQTAVRLRDRDIPILQGNPFVTPLERMPKDARRVPLALWGDHESGSQSFLGAWHTALGNSLGVSIPMTKLAGDIHLSEEEKRRPSPAFELAGYRGRYWLISITGWHDCPTKWWDPRYAQRLADLLDGKIKLVHVGAVQGTPPIPGAISLLHRTSMRDLIRMVYHADGVISYVGGIMTMAAAVPTRPGAPSRRPFIVLSGGRESPQLHQYQAATVLHTIGQLDCCVSGGCFKYRTSGVDPDCKYPVDNGDGLMLAKCMTMIQPETVAEKAISIQQGIESFEKSPPRSDRVHVVPKPSRPFTIGVHRYEVDGTTGITHQLDAKPIQYTADYLSDGSRTTEQMSYLRMGLIASLIGFDRLRSMTAIEIGPGNGVFFQVLKKHLRSVEGYDAAPSPYSTLTLEEARARRFNLLIACDVIEHFESAEDLFRFDFDYAYISVPAMPERALMSGWRHLKPDEHLWHFNEQSFREWVQTQDCNVLYAGDAEDLLRPRWREDKRNINSFIIHRSQVPMMKDGDNPASHHQKYPCIHLGEFKREQGCSTCNDNRKAEIFQCGAGRGECSPFDLPLPGVSRCSPGCFDFKPKAPSSAR